MGEQPNFGAEVLKYNYLSHQTKKPANSGLSCSSHITYSAADICRSFEMSRNGGAPNRRPYSRLN